MTDMCIDTTRVGIQDFGAVCYSSTTVFIGREDLYRQGRLRITREYNVDLVRLDLITSRNWLLGREYCHSQFSSLELGCNISI